MKQDNPQGDNFSIIGLQGHGYLFIILSFFMCLKFSKTKIFLKEQNTFGVPPVRAEGV